MSQAISMDRSFEQTNWRTVLCWVGAILSAILFLSSGIWKIADPFGWSVLLHQLKVPQAVSLPFAVALGTVETVTGILFLLPAYRRLAALLATSLLVVFMIYMGVNYTALHGADCSCFPWVKRAVDPAFFAEDAGMIVLALMAGVWARATGTLRGAYVTLGVVAAVALISVVISSARQTGTKAPDTIVVAGKPYDISHGKVFIYFYDPECTHCLAAGERMSKLDWGQTKFVGQPVVNPQFAPFFVSHTGLKGVTASDFPLLKKTFPYTSTPAAVAVENGRQVAALSKFDDDEPVATILKLGFAK